MKTAHATKQFQCELCEFTCGRKDNLNRHIDSHTKTKTQVTKRKATNSASNEKKRTKLYMDDDIFNSDDEDQIFNETYIFNNQKRNKIDTYDDEWEKVEKDKGTPMDVDPIKKHTFKCKQCLFRSQNKEEFEEHIRTRHGIKCELCDQEFKEVKNLNKHMKNVHEEKSLKCNNCSYITNDVPSMQRHTA